MRHAWWGALCLGMAATAWATSPDALRKQADVGMVVSGTIEVAPDGSVAKYALREPDELPPAVKDLLQKTIPTWRFEPLAVDGKPADVEARMGIRVVASPIGGGQYRIGVAGAWFGAVDGAAAHGPSETPTYRRKVQPTYPMDAARAHVAGTVYAMLKVGRDGKVHDAAAEQVDLRVVGTGSEMAYWRRRLASAALRALRDDTFNPPTTGSRANRPYWVVRIPVTFNLQGPTVARNSRRATYGQWQAYIPGPVSRPAWADGRPSAGSADALPADGNAFVDASLHLLTPLGSS